MKKIPAIVGGLIGLGFMMGAARAEAQLDLVPPLTQYKVYVTGEVDKLVAETKKFAAAVKTGKIEEAKALYGPTRQHYERIEPIAELFDDLDKAIDSRADDYEAKEKDPGFPGFHRIEYALWSEKSTKAAVPVAEKLVANVEELKKRLKELTFPPEKVVGGAAALIEEVAKTKISGEEDRYSGTDLYDFEANFAGAKKIVELFRKQIEKADAKLLTEIEGNFSKVEKVLAKYKTKTGYENYEKLSKEDKNALQAAITPLVEDLSKLRGALGLS